MSRQRRSRIETLGSNFVVCLEERGLMLGLFPTWIDRGYRLVSHRHDIEGAKRELLADFEVVGITPVESDPS